MTEPSLQKLVSIALAEQPDSRGGIAIVMASGASPPALAVLSTGDVLLEDDIVRVGIHASSSVVTRLGGSFSLLIPLEQVAVRMEVVDATVAVGRHLATIEGRLARLRPTTEPPWTLDMRFSPAPPDDERIQRYVEYWQQVRSWLSGLSPEPELPFMS